MKIKYFDKKINNKIMYYRKNKKYKINFKKRGEKI